MYKVLISILFLLLTTASFAETRVSKPSIVTACLPALAGANAPKPDLFFQGSPDSASAKQKAIIVKSSSPVITIRLSSNRATGFSWFLLSNNKSALIKVLSVKYQPGNLKMAGAPGVSIWKFKLDDDAFSVPRILHITMLYAQSWNLKSIRRKVITIVTRQE